MSNILIYIDEYLCRLKTKNYAENTIRNKTLYLMQFQAFCEQKNITDINDIEPKHLKEFTEFLIELRNKHKIKNKSENDYNNYIRDKMLNLGQFFYYLLEQNKILRNPFDKLKLPKRPLLLPKNILSEEKILALINAPEKLNSPTSLRDKAMIELVYSSALRRGEIVNLTIQDIDLANHQVFIKLGKSRRDRILPVGASAVLAIKNYLEKSRTLWLKSSKVKHLFLTINGEPLKKYSMTEILAKYTKKLCFQKTGWHTIRHTCATHLLQHGADIRYIQELLGHGSLHTTEIYTKVANPDLQKNIETALNKARKSID